MHKSFDHEVFAEKYECSHNFMITYNVNDRLLELYKDYHLEYWKLRYSMVHRGDKNTQDNVKYRTFSYELLSHTTNSD